MLHAIAAELTTALATRDVPFKVHYSDAPEASGISWLRIVLDEDMDAGDSFSAPSCQHRNPPSVGTLAVGAVFRIWAVSEVRGATAHNHRAMARQMLDHLLVALDQVGKSRVNVWRWKSGKFLKPEAIDPLLAGMRNISGVVYELRGTFDRGVFGKTWQGEIQPTVTVGPDGAVIRQDLLVVESDPDEEYTR